MGVRVAIIGIALAAGFATVNALGTAQRERAPLLPLTFAHNDHRAENCATCHHDYVDGAGPGLCLDCHKRDLTLAPEIAEQFHSLCQGCHLDHALGGEEHGPLRRCQGCHVQDTDP
ncbi:MAG: cytochrome c3 family protein [Pseudomonadota bacterium]